MNASKIAIKAWGYAIHQKNKSLAGIVHWHPLITRPAPNMMYQDILKGMKTENST